MYEIVENLKMSKMLSALKVINTRILMHCAAVIAATLMVSWLEIKPYGVLFLILLVLWVYKTRCAASIKIIPPPELNTKVCNYYEKLLQLRKDRPTLFCAIITSVLGVLAVIGHLVSGSNVVICGLILSALLSTRYNFKILKVPNKERLSWVDLATDNDVDEFLPEVNDSNLFVLQRASDQALVTTTTTGSTTNSAIDDDDNKSDEIPSELLIPDSIPEIDENSESSSDDELIPKLSGNDNNKSLHLKNKHKNNEERLEDGDDGNEEKSLEFKKGYFKKDSSISTSSSDDESLSKGLNFNDYTVVDGRNKDNSIQKPNQYHRTTGIVSVANTGVTSILPNLVSGLMSSLQQGTMSSSTTVMFKPTSSPSLDNTNEQFSDTSEESDFEILNTDDLNNP